MSALVRDKLWKKVCSELDIEGGALLIHHSQDEPGFRLLSHGKTTRRIIEHEGLQLIQKDHPNEENAFRKLAAELPKGDRRKFDWSQPPGSSQVGKKEDNDQME